MSLYLKLKQMVFFEKNRKEQSLSILNDTIDESLKNSFYTNPTIRKLIDDYSRQIYNDEVNPYEVAQLLLDKYFDGV